MTAIVFLIIRIILAVALYAFLGLAIYTLWMDLSQQRLRVNRPQSLPIALTRQDDPAAQAFRYRVAEITIGRDPACNLHLDDPTISAQHARLSFHHGQWWVEDLSSTNGTFVNNDPIHAPLVLTDRDVLRCGRITLLIGIG